MIISNDFRSNTLDKVWLKRYPADVPAEIDADRYSSLIEMFEHAVQRYADQPAFINMGEVMTFRKLEERSRAFAAYLQNELGLKKGDRVALMMPNLLQYPIALFGILRAGMVVVNVNPLYTPRELEHQLNDSGASAIVIVSNFAHTLEKVVFNTQVKHVILTRMGDQLSAAKGTLVNFVVKYVKRLVPKYNLPDAISFRSALQRGRRLQYVKPDIINADLAFLQYTGGTTGVAKGAMLTHRNMQANLEQAKAAYSPLFREGQELVVTALPLYHICADGELPAVYRSGRAQFVDHQPARYSRAGEGTGQIPVHRHERGEYVVQRIAEQRRVPQTRFLYAAFLGRRRHVGAKSGGREVGENHRQTPAGRLWPDGVRAAGGR